MSTHKHFDKICCVVLVFTLILTVLFVNAAKFGVQSVSAVVGYGGRLFDISSVHSIDIVMDDWDGFLETCTAEDYTACTLIIDGETYKDVAIRAKGNTSLSMVQSYDNDRYSFKVEFDHYDNGKTYYGLDKLCLNNIIQDNTYMKDFLTYQMMADFGVASPLCSYANISVNGEAWGLYLAIEGVEESFLERNYGNDYGELYKPDSMGMGGGPGNGKDFRMSEWEGPDDQAGGIHPDTSVSSDIAFGRNKEQTSYGDVPGSFDPDGGQVQGGMAPPKKQNGTDGTTSDGAMQPEDKPVQSNPDNEQGQKGFERGDNDKKQRDGGMGGPGMGSDDVSLIYSDEEYDSYSNIFDNAKTDISDTDKDRLIQAIKNINENTELESSVDVEQVIRYFVVHNFVLNFDSYTGAMIHNYYLYEDDGVLSMIPWDYNLAFGGFKSEDGAASLVNYPVDSPVSGGTVDSRPMIAWIFNNEEYTELYHDMFAKFIAQYFESGKFTEMMDMVKEMISPYVENDPTKFCTYEEFITGIDTLKEFCQLRAESISGQLNGSIGSTTETQSTDTLIDAGDLKVSDMGSMGDAMGHGGGMGGGKPDGADGNPTTSRENADSSISENIPVWAGGESRDAPSNDMDSDTGEERQMPDGAGREGGRSQRPDMPGQEPLDIRPAGIWIGISFGILFLGLVFASLFKRRRYAR